MTGDWLLNGVSGVWFGGVVPGGVVGTLEDGGGVLPPLSPPPPPLNVALAMLAPEATEPPVPLGRWARTLIDAVLAFPLAFNVTEQLVPEQNLPTPPLAEVTPLPPTV
ncbi:hypothetical protein ACSNOI_12775 [Actinomadura kijaniata]|uniref:hypothetical protein n=1 Tax=Actinomadura kijaniata TaxID=46161 RepID=UPI003F1A5B00